MKIYQALYHKDRYEKLKITTTTKTEFMRNIEAFLFTKEQAWKPQRLVRNYDHQLNRLLTVVKCKAISVAKTALFYFMKPIRWSYQSETDVLKNSYL